MSNQKNDETTGEELFIEELNEVRGGAPIPGNLTMTLARGLGEEGVSWVRPKPVPPKLPLLPRPPVWSTMALGEEGTSLPPNIVPMGDD